MKGLLRRMGLTPKMYSALLLAADVVRTKNDVVCFRADECKEQFIHHDVRSEGTAQFSQQWAIRVYEGASVDGGIKATCCWEEARSER